MESSDSARQTRTFKEPVEGGRTQKAKGWAKACRARGVDLLARRFSSMAKRIADSHRQ